MSERRHRLVVGGIAIAAGVATALIAHAHPETMKAPAWVVYVACACFVLCGLSIVARDCGLRRFQSMLGLAGTTALFLPLGWIAFGPGDRACSVSLPFFSAAASEYACRGAFGLGAVAGAAMVAAVGWRAFRSRNAG